MMVKSKCVHPPFALVFSSVWGAVAVYTERGAIPNDGFSLGLFSFFYTDALVSCQNWLTYGGGWNARLKGSLAQECSCQFQVLPLAVSSAFPTESQMIT